jgi:hypothetical protein
MLRDVQGSDPVDTAAREPVAFGQRRQVNYDIALSRRRTDLRRTSAERRLANAHYAAGLNVWQPALCADRVSSQCTQT